MNGGRNLRNKVQPQFWFTSYGVNVESVYLLQDPVFLPTVRDKAKKVICVKICPL